MQQQPMVTCSASDGGCCDIVNMGVGLEVAFGVLYRIRKQVRSIVG